MKAKLIPALAILIAGIASIYLVMTTRNSIYVIVFFSALFVYLAFAGFKRKDLKVKFKISKSS